LKCDKSEKLRRKSQELQIRNYEKRTAIN